MSQPASAAPAEPSLAHGRLLIFLASVLWSTNGFFFKVLTLPSFLEVNEPPLQPQQIAFFRLLFAGLFLAPLLRGSDLRLRPAMIAMALCFAVMNMMFVHASTMGPAANAILLQYTAPLWVYLVSIAFLGAEASWRSSVAVLFGVLGVGVIMAGGWSTEDPSVLLLGAGSGVAFAGVLLFLSVLRAQPSAWLTVWNHLAGALILAPFGLITDWETLEVSLPTGPQLVVLFVFGAMQMGLPYFLMARGLRVVSPQEAGAITLLEALLNPLWAYLVSPATETPGLYTVCGGALILLGLAWRYWPAREPQPPLMAGKK